MRRRPTFRASPWSRSSSSSWAGRSPTGSICWVGDIANLTSSSGCSSSRWDSWGCPWFIPGTSLSGFTALAVLTVAGLALYDTCCDGMVIDVTPPADRDRVQGLLVASRAAAAMICTLGFGFMLEATGNGPGRASPVLWICAGLGSGTPDPRTLACRSHRGPRTPKTSSGAALGVLLRPRSLVLLAFGAFYSLVGYGVEINLSPFYGRELRLPRANHRRTGRGTLHRAGHRRGALAGARACGWDDHACSWTGLLALACFTASQAMVSRPVPAGLAGARVRRGQRLDRCRLLRPGDGVFRSAGWPRRPMLCSWP